MVVEEKKLPHIVLKQIRKTIFSGSSTGIDMHKMSPTDTLTVGFHEIWSSSN